MFDVNQRPLMFFKTSEAAPPRSRLYFAQKDKPPFYPHSAIRDTFSAGIPHALGVISSSLLFKITIDFLFSLVERKRADFFDKWEN